jgi:hypothetical protein
MSELRTATSAWVRGVTAMSLIGALAWGSALFTPRGSAATLSAKALLARALANARGSHWVHETVYIEEEGVVVEVSHNVIGTGGGEQSSILANGGTSQLIALDQKKEMFVRASSAALTLTYSMTSADATTYANKWLELIPSTSIYRSVAYATSLASDFSQVRFVGRLQLGGVGTLKGEKVRAIAGVVPAVNSAPRFNGTLEVTAQGPLLPVRFHEIHGSTVIIVTWSDWGHGTTLTAPSGATTFP